jgi:putative DNA primase/helicase
VLDEIGIADSREIGQVVYTLCGGTGKGRAGRDGSLRASNTWRSQIISTGEMRVIDKIVEGGKRSRAGQEVRIVDIPADAGRGFGIFDHAGEENDPGKLADKIKAAARTYFGTAGPALVQGVVKKGTDAVAEQVRAAIEVFRSTNVDGAADGQVKRVTNRFALAAAAGELAIELGIVPWQPGEATTAAAALYTAWLDSRGGLEPAEIRNIIQQVRGFIERYGESRFDPIEGAERPALERYGWRRGEGDAREWLILPETWRTVFTAGYDPTTVARTLAERGMLIPDKQQFSRSEWCGERSHRVYVLTAKILAGESPSKPTSEGSGAPPPNAPLPLEDLSALL